MNQLKSIYNGPFIHACFPIIASNVKFRGEYKCSKVWSVGMITLPVQNWKGSICTNTCGNWHPHLFCILRYFAFMWCKLSWHSDDQRPNTDPTCLEATVSSFDITFCNEGWLHFMIVKPCTVFCMVWVWTNKLLNGWFNINIGEHCQEVHFLTKSDSIRQISVQIGK